MIFELNITSCVYDNPFSVGFFAPGILQGYGSVKDEVAWRGIVIERKISFADKLEMITRYCIPELRFQLRIGNYL